MEKLNVQSVVVVYDILYLPPAPPVAANANFKSQNLWKKNAGLSVFAAQVQNRQPASAKIDETSFIFLGAAAVCVRFCSHANTANYLT